MTGMFVVFEGGEGSGKSTQTRMLGKALTELDVPHIVTREPGDTPLGVELRNILLRRGGTPLHKRAEALLFMADRAQHVEEVVWPALRADKLVVCDRYTASTIAYQGYANGLGVAQLRSISEWASDGLQPDITYFLDVNPAVGLERSKREEHTRFEDKAVQYHVTVRDGFIKQKTPKWHVINADIPAAEIHKSILMHVLKQWYARPAWT
jgi:dTMP kinase